MATGLPTGMRNRHLRGAVTVPAVTAGAVALAASAAVRVPTAAGDPLRGRNRLC